MPNAFIPNNFHLRNVVLFLFLSGLNVKDIHEKLTATYDTNAPSQTTIYRYVARYKEEDYSFEGEPKLNWKDMDGTYYPHPPYSPDLAPSDYHLFRHLSHCLRGQNFKDRKDVESALKGFFGSQIAEFYRADIHVLPGRWKKTANANGNYF
ncbi:hypothetical protein WR25_16747 [Diploscapter pachys]|uniref:Mos1 transposase HTH domain-containing protein n=1 Tax=Diploscapter pachys TaxID=2018661 RepID=A0A2A2J5N2_9BILA|nr:hypothetical protein WR25_16747 [Diploscapter pachys]